MTNLNPTCWWSIFNSSNHPKNLGPLKLWWWKIIIDGVCIEENIFIHKIKTKMGIWKDLKKPETRLQASRLSPLHSSPGSHWWITNKLIMILRTGHKYYEIILQVVLGKFFVYIFVIPGQKIHPHWRTYSSKWLFKRLESPLKMYFI